jgi:hypothetical protein
MPVELTEDLRNEYLSLVFQLTGTLRAEGPRRGNGE